MEKEKDTADETGAEPQGTPGGAGVPAENQENERLKKAYDALLKEFTRRCQKLKDAERRNEEIVLQSRLREKEMTEQMLDFAKDRLNDAAFLESYVLTNETIQSRIIESYLMSLQKSPLPGVLRTGVGSSVLTPPALPKSLEEARRLASMILKA